MFGGAEIANLKSFDPHVRLVLNGEHTLPIFRGEAGCVEDSNLAGVASESDKPVVRLSGHIDSHQLLVRPGARVNPAAGMGCVGRLLSRFAWWVLGAGVGIVARLRHITGGIKIR